MLILVISIFSSVPIPPVVEQEGIAAIVLQTPRSLLVRMEPVKKMQIRVSARIIMIVRLLVESMAFVA